MSAASSKQKGWIQQNGEKLALIVVSLLLLGSAVFLMIAIGNEQMALNSGRAMAKPSEVNNALPLEFDAYQSLVDRYRTPFTPAPNPSNKLMVSELRVRSVNPNGIPAPIPYGADVCPFTGHPQPKIAEWDSDLGGIPDSAERSFDLDPNDPEDDRADSDEDGFTNYEEYQAGTDPRDPADSPSLLAKLRVLRVRTNPFKLRFQGVSEFPDGQRFQLNLRSLDRTYFAKMGEEIEGYKVTSYDEAGSELILEKDGRQTPLVKGRVISRSERSIVLISLVDYQRLPPVRVGETFELKGNEYKVIDIRRNGVLIRDLADNETTLVSRLTETERMEIQREISGESAPARGPGFQNTF